MLKTQNSQEKYRWHDLSVLRVMYILLILYISSNSTAQILDVREEEESLKHGFKSLLESSEIKCR